MSKSVSKESPTEILNKAIQKAIDGGWSKRSQFLEANNIKLANDMIYPKNDRELWSFHISEIIFNHEFAKALWGEWSREELKAEYHNIYELEPWQYHLQQMVIAEDPIKYLGENIWTTKHYPL